MIPGPMTTLLQKRASGRHSPMFFFFNNKEEVDSILTLKGAAVMGGRIKLTENIAAVCD